MSAVGEPARERPALRVALVAGDPIRHQGLMAIIRGGGHAVVEHHGEADVVLVDGESIDEYGHLPSPWAERIAARRGHYPPTPRRFRSMPRCSPRRPG
jgi:hypothetical protein